MNKPTLPGTTGYAPVKGAVFPGRVCTDGIYRSPENEAAWRSLPAPGTPEHNAHMAACGRAGLIRGHMGEAGRDHDREYEIDRYEDYDATPRQGQV